MSRLLLSLGHNSSAVLVQNGHVVAGFEQERLSKKKSDSRFPAAAMAQLKYLYPDKWISISDVYVSHWYPNGELPQIQDKYWDPIYFHHNFPNHVKVHSLTPEFTHHDAHAWSAKTFVGPTFPTADTMIMVADGFGNFGETLSLYDMTSQGTPVLKHRSHGYETSLGLMYQYATAFLGLKENQDEYKLLGYEAHIQKYFLEEEIEAIGELAHKDAMSHMEAFRNPLTSTPYDPVISVDALPAIRVQYARYLQEILDDFGVNEAYSEEARRAFIAFYVQTRIEETVTMIVQEHKPENLIVVGGIFMNVKLNNVLSRLVGEFSIMPLAGDQGAPIGLYEAMEGDFIWPDHLFWGTREFYPIEGERLIYCEDRVTAIDTAIELLKNNSIVNMVMGNMEFGARALGHTTTLAWPTSDNVDYINTLNGRSTIMPMAPIMTRDAANQLFLDVHKVHQSLEYMICTRDYREEHNALRGAAHTTPIYDPDSPVGLTGRPQIIDENHDLYRILNEMPYKTLINTSFNEHGMPICYSMNDVLRCHEYQIYRDTQKRVYTVIVR